MFVSVLDYPRDTRKIQDPVPLLHPRSLQTRTPLARPSCDTPTIRLDTLQPSSRPLLRAYNPLHSKPSGYIFQPPFTYPGWTQKRGGRSFSNSSHKRSSIRPSLYLYTFLFGCFPELFFTTAWTVALAKNYFALSLCMISGTEFITFFANFMQNVIHFSYCNDKRVILSQAYELHIVFSQLSPRGYTGPQRRYTSYFLRVLCALYGVALPVWFFLFPLRASFIFAFKFASVLLCNLRDWWISFGITWFMKMCKLNIFGPPQLWEGILDLVCQDFVIPILDFDHLSLRCMIVP